MALEPIKLFRNWYAAAARAKLPQYDGMALATASASGKPDVRFVLLKSVDERGFVFYTNLLSPKGRALKANPRAALAFYWDRPGRQVRVRGTVRPVSDAEADAYFASRPRLSQLGAWASEQSRPVSSRAVLVARVAKLALAAGRRSIPRPDHWSGFRLLPSEIEFWQRGAGRLHTRWLYTRSGSRWRRVLLQP